MELNNQIKKYRTDMNLSQEELGEKVFVTRQTISNWETSKSYPDIHSLLLLSSFFHISLDQLIKGDIKTMKEEINKNELQKFNRDGSVFAALYSVTLYFACKVEKSKKRNDIHTFKEIVAFTEGKQLDEIEKYMEIGKRPYQTVFSALVCALFAFVVCVLFVWMLKPFIF